jgi:hypothetical protein
MSGYLDGDDAFDRLLSHHTDTVIAMAKRQAALEDADREMRLFKDRLEKSEATLHQTRLDYDALEKRAMRDEAVVKHLQATLAADKFAKLVENAEAIPF